MIDSNRDSAQAGEGLLPQSEALQNVPKPKKGPANFFVGAITSGLMGLLCLRLSQGMVTYFTLHSTDYSSPIAQSVASGFKTLVIGICFLATFTFSFIGLGLLIVFFRSLFAVKDHDPV